MIGELLWKVIQLILVIIHWISVISAKVLTLFLVIYAIVIIVRIFKTRKLVNPKGRAVLITGCDSGFGNRLALRLNEMGYRVYATVLNSNAALNLIQMSAHKEQMVVWKMDVTVEEDVEEVLLNVKHDLERNGCGLWAVVNNAGFGILAQLEWTNLAQHKRLFEVNVFGLVRVTKAFLPLIRESKGRIVNMSSLFGYMSLNGFGAYAMTKHAVTAFSRILRQEMSRYGVKVVVLYPGGFTDTNFVDVQNQSAYRIWDDLEDSLKTSYGDKQYFEMWKHSQLSRLNAFMGDNSECVIDAMVEAVTDSNCKQSCTIQPKSVYNYYGYIVRCFPYLMDKIDSK